MNNIIIPIACRKYYGIIERLENCSNHCTIDLRNIPSRNDTPYPKSNSICIEIIDSFDHPPELYRNDISYQYYSVLSLDTIDGMPRSNLSYFSNIFGYFIDMIKSLLPYYATGQMNYMV